MPVLDNPAPVPVVIDTDALDTLTIAQLADPAMANSVVMLAVIRVVLPRDMAAQTAILKAAAAWMGVEL